MTIFPGPAGKTLFDKAPSAELRAFPRTRRENSDRH